MGLISKLKTAISDPARVRNYALGTLNRWPVRHIDNPHLVDMPVYCISPPSARRRRALMERQARAAGLTRFQFVDAIDGRTTGLARFVESGDYDPVEAARHHERGLTVGEVATTLSHGMAYEAIVEAGHPRALILEDDALFVSRRLSRLDLGEAPDGWDVLFLNSFVREEPPPDHVAGNVYGTDSWYGSAAAYVLTADGAQKLAEIFRPVIHAADGLLGRNLRPLADGRPSFRGRGARTVLNAYLVYPHPFLNGSTVGFTGTLLDT